MCEDALREYGRKEFVRHDAVAGHNMGETPEGTGCRGKRSSAPSVKYLLKLYERAAHGDLVRVLHGQTKVWY